MGGTMPYRVCRGKANLAAHLPAPPHRHRGEGEAAVSDLDLGTLPALPQTRTIRALADRLWRDERVVALWIGGSLARGAGDPYSDIDLRVAVAPPDLAAWEAPTSLPFDDGEVVGRHFIPLGEGAFIHHLVVRDGDILDLLVQSTAHPPVAEPILILGCRDAAFARALAADDRVPAAPHAPATPEAVRDLVVAFWINSHKHRKVLHRDLDLMFAAGAHANWMMLMCLWYVEATGEEAGPFHFSGIHGLTALVRAVGGADAAGRLALCGLPTRDRAEIRAAIERHREEAARVGRRLAVRYDFEYPAALEQTVRRAWDEFTAREGAAGAV